MNLTHARAVFEAQMSLGWLLAHIKLAQKFDAYDLSEWTLDMVTPLMEKPAVERFRPKKGVDPVSSRVATKEASRLATIFMYGDKKLGVEPIGVRLIKKYARGEELPWYIITAFDQLNEAQATPKP